jgi:hypothetical protein
MNHRRGKLASGRMERKKKEERGKARRCRESSEEVSETEKGRLSLNTIDNVRKYGNQAKVLHWFSDQ